MICPNCGKDTSEPYCDVPAPAAEPRTNYLPVEHAYGTVEAQKEPPPPAPQGVAGRLRRHAETQDGDLRADLYEAAAALAALAQEQNLSAIEIANKDARIAHWMTRAEQAERELADAREETIGKLAAALESMRAERAEHLAIIHKIGVEQDCAQLRAEQAERERDEALDLLRLIDQRGLSAPVQDKLDEFLEAARKEEK